MERPLDQALSVAQTYYSNLERTALRHGQHIGRVIDRDGLLAEDRREALASFLVEQQDLLGISTITVLERPTARSWSTSRTRSSVICRRAI